MLPMSNAIVDAFVKANDDAVAMMQNGERDQAIAFSVDCMRSRTRDKLFAGYPTGQRGLPGRVRTKFHTLFLGVQHCIRRYYRHSTF
jgi:hypothetical protein